MARSRNDIHTLVQGFAEHLKHIKGPEYKEFEVRLHYVDPFWELLGWDVRNDQQLPPQDLEVKVEPSMESVGDEGLRVREPDYLFRINGFGRFIVEAKKPSVELDEDRSAIFQAKRYAWNATLPFAILTDFEHFRLFDTTLKPILTEPRRGMIKEFRLQFGDYPAQWDVLESTFGRDAVAAGSLERLRAQIRKVPAGRRIRTVDRMLIDLRGDEPVDRVFLEYLEKHRHHLAREIYRQNKNQFPEADTPHGAAKLTEAVQRLIDRLVFMRVCEDRNIAMWGGLRATLDRMSREGGDLFAALSATFRELDREYNGYLFKYHFLESLNVPEHCLADFVRNLYPPEGPWDFSKIADDILGIVYERFLGSVVTVKKNNVEVVEKPEVRHAGGVYYTPRFIVDTIIRRVLGPQLAGKTPMQVLDVKTLDPACGSGSFLVAAFQFLIDHCCAAIAADPTLATVPATAKARKKRKEIAFRDPKGRWRLAPDFKAALLTHCIHGVDIDQQAVEVTVMSLYLKMLEGELPPNWQRDWVENQLLPPLDNNIYCGNSLIDSADFDRWYAKLNGDLFPMDDDTRFRINRFDWTSRTRGLGRILDPNAAQDRGQVGFDCIIGNPPYIRVQELNKWAPEECEFYKWRYKSAAKGNYDIYVVFVEKSLSLLASNGLLGFIVPHKFWQAKYGEGLRKIITDGKHLRSVVDFGDQQVFSGASIYTAIHVFSERRRRHSVVEFARITRLEDGQAQCSAVDVNKTPDGAIRFSSDHPATNQPWVFGPRSQMDHMKVVENASDARLRDVTTRMAQGIRTSANPIFVLRRLNPRRHVYFSPERQAEVELEPTFLRRFLSAHAMRRYEVLPSDEYVLFPYEMRPGDGARLIPTKDLQEQAPLTWKYLRAFEKRLRGRERGRMDHDGWYGYVYPKNIELMGQTKILVPDIIERSTFSLDAYGEFAFVSGYAIVPGKPFLRAIEYLLGLLNSSLLGDYLKRVSTTLRGGWFRPFPQFMSQLPIKVPGTKDEKRLADRIVESVRAIMDAKVKLRDANLSDRERTQLERTVDAHEGRIEEAVFTLYGVEGLPEA